MSNAHDLSSLESSLRARFDLVDETIEVAGRAWRMLHPKSADDLISEEDFDIDERLPYWAEVWPSSRVLAARLAFLATAQRTSDGCVNSAGGGDGPTLLELGTGSGLAAIVAQAVGYRVVATDYYQEALDFCRLNAHRNGVTIPEVRLVDWRRWPDDIGRFDLVAAGDVLYERPYAALVAEVYARTLAADGLGLMADPRRRPAEGFPDECRQRGLMVELWGSWEATSGPVRQDVDVYKIQKLPAGSGRLSAISDQRSAVSDQL